MLSFLRAKPKYLMEANRKGLLERNRGMAKHLISVESVSWSLLERIKEMVPLLEKKDAICPLMESKHKHMEAHLGCLAPSRGVLVI